MSEVKGAAQLLNEAADLFTVIEQEVMQRRDPITDLVTTWRRDYAAWVRWTEEPTVNTHA